MTERLVKANAETNPEHGCSPDERTPEELIRLGCIVLDKPAGPSSHQVAAWVRDIFGVSKAGHAGTLDPNVTGVLPIGLADATKALSQLKDQDKAYVGVIVLHDDVDSNVLAKQMRGLTGEIEQMPPKRSAVKRRLRTRRVDRFDLLERDGRNALVRVDCEGGTYVRTLASELGERLGVGAHLQELRRVRAGPIGEERAVNLHTVKDAFDEWNEEGRDDWLRDAVLPVERFLDHVATITVRDTAVDAVCHGAPLGLPGVLAVDKEIQPGDPVVVSTLKGEAVAISTARMASLEMMMRDGGIAAEPERTIMEPGTYPKGW